MLTRAQKEEQIADLRERFARATCVYVADYSGIDVHSANQLRRRVRHEGGGDYEYRVAKNTVLRRAAEGSDVASIAERFEGPTAVALSYGDPAGLAKILADFASEHEAFEVKGGLLSGEVVGPAEVATLATLPSLDELRARLVGLVQAPATKLVRLLLEPAAQLARLADARGRQGEGEG